MFRRADAYGDTLDSYDTLKLIALFTMVIDHMGLYFWPDAEFMRAIGRTAFPLFLFLVGYSGTWKIKPDLLLCAGLIIICAALTHHAVLPFNILATIAVTRILMGWLARKEITPKYLRGIFLNCIVWYPFMYWCDYSTVAVLFAMSGYVQRKQPGSLMALVFLYAATAVHFFIEAIIFHPHVLGTMLMIASALAILALLQNFTLRPLSMTGWARRPLQWMARNTLPLYTLHLIVFMMLERVLFPERLLHFAWW